MLQKEKFMAKFSFTHQVAKDRREYDDTKRGGAYNEASYSRR